MRRPWTDPLASPAPRVALVGLALCLSSQSACTQKKKNAPQDSPKQVQPQPPKAEAKAKPTPTPAKKEAAPVKAMDIAKPQAKFASTLFGLVSKTVKAEQNFVLSPMSVYLALGMTRLGAKGQTASTLNQTLSLPTDASAPSVAASMGQAQRTWTQSRPGAQLALANRLFADETFKVQPSFVELTQKELGAGIQNLAFSRDPDKSRQIINQWVETQTKSRIKDLLAPGNVRANTRMVLVNAIWFKGEWAHQFKTKDTKPRPFLLANKKRVKVPTMAMTHDLPLLKVQSQGYSAIDLPYADGRLAMTIILPKRGLSAAELSSSIDLAELSKGVGQAMPQKVSLELPKFTIDPQSSISLRPQLSSMGAKTIFGSPSPDFSALAQASEKLAVQDVLHKAMIIVDEKGAEAAAATAVTTYRSAAIPKVHEFHVDRPFLFMIRDKKDASILFAGRVAHPKAP